MTIFNDLQNKVKELYKVSSHKRYYFKVLDVLTIMICGALCTLTTIYDIYEWVKAEPTKDFY